MRTRLTTLTKNTYLLEGESLQASLQSRESPCVCVCVCVCVCLCVSVPVFVCISTVNCLEADGV